MFLSQKGSLGRNPMINRVGQRLLQLFEGASAAYSLRDLASNIASVVRVRRASDNSEKDFSAADVSSGAMTQWVNAQVVPPLDVRELVDGERTGALIPAAAAYSLRNLSTSYTGNVVDVRRSSDDAVDSFTAAEVADGTLTDWVTEEQVGWNVQPTWDVSSGDGVISSQSSTATTSTFSITTTSGTSFVRQTSKPNHIIASSGDQVVANIIISGLDSTAIARLRTSGTNTNVATVTLTNGTADYTLNLTGSAGYFVFSSIEATSGATITINSVKVIGKSGFVTQWYDQSGNANHATQTDAASQPKIVEGGSLVSGGLDFNNDVLVASSVSGLTGSMSMFSASTRDSSGYTVSLSNSSSGGRYFGVHELATTSTATIRNTTVVNLNSPVSGNDRLTFALTNGDTSTSVGAKGATVTTSTSDYGQDFSGSNINQIAIGVLRTVSPTGYFNGRVKELIIYDSDQSDNRTAFEANIGETYGIDLPSGVDTGYDQVDGFVETWYDQSGNGNDAVQATASNQPKIVDAGVLVSGGIDFDAGFDCLDLPTVISSINAASSFVVAKTTNASLTQSALALSRNAPQLARFYAPIAIGGSFYFGYGLYSSTINLGLADTSEHLFTATAGSSTAEGFIDGTSGGTVSSVDSYSEQTEGGIGNINGTTEWVGTIREIIIYPSDQSANRAAIETNINNQYDIY